MRAAGRHQPDATGGRGSSKARAPPPYRTDPPRFTREQAGAAGKAPQSPHRQRVLTLNWSLITHLGDAALVLPLIVAAALGLALQGTPQRRAALTWCAIAATSLLLVAASKIAFYGWGTGVRAWDLTCFSGHTVSAWLTWPALLMLSAPRHYRALRIGMLCAGIAIAAVVGWSRVPLGAHPVSEVIAGTALGAAGAWLSVRALRDQALGGRGLGVVMAVLLALALVSQTSVARPNSERWFQAVGVALSGADAPVDRRAWRKGAP